MPASSGSRLAPEKKKIVFQRFSIAPCGLEVVEPDDLAVGDLAARLRRRDRSAARPACGAVDWRVRAPRDDALSPVSPGPTSVSLTVPPAIVDERAMPAPLVMQQDAARRRRSAPAPRASRRDGLVGEGQIDVAAWPPRRVTPGDRLPASALSASRPFEVEIGEVVERHGELDRLAEHATGRPRQPVRSMTPAPVETSAAQQPALLPAGRIGNLAASASWTMRVDSPTAPRFAGSTLPPARSTGSDQRSSSGTPAAPASRSSKAAATRKARRARRRRAPSHLKRRSAA